MSNPDDVTILSTTSPSGGNLELFQSTDVYRYDVDNRPLMHFKDNDIALKTGVNLALDELYDGRLNAVPYRYANLKDRLDAMDAGWPTLPLALASGGTGQITANAALNAILPTQTAQIGKVLGTDGSNTSWIVGGGGGSGIAYAQITDSAAIASTTAPTAFSKNYTIPGNSLVVGSVIHVRFIFSAIALVAASLTYTLRIGGSTLATYSDTWGSAGSATNPLDLYVGVRTIGSSGTFQSYSDGSQATLNTTSGLVVDATATWTVSNPGNTVTQKGLTVEISNAAATS